MDIHLEQDGATCHTTRENMSLLRDYFPGRRISWFLGVGWPARSPDLSPLIFSFWGHLKERVYWGNPRTFSELKEAISKDIRCFGSVVTKAVLTVWRKELKIVSNQEVTTWKTLYLRSNDVKFFNLWILKRPCFIFNPFVNFWVIKLRWGPVLINHPV